MPGSPLLDRHQEALDLFSSHVHAVRDDQWGAPTPCAEWSVRDLVNHLTGEQLWVPDLVREGRSVAEVGDAYDGDVLAGRLGALGADDRPRGRSVQVVDGTRVA
ncbi:maleylpyruvate isomerase family mycothiol-dependent enzyme, partial [Streptomyces fradiae]|uniref:maleylpyruvate isomerase family mycothiol-dependent enzyme n=1 Tax=Streptomyces fradiae TaxID=1906 RepID=UPI00342D4542